MNLREGLKYTENYLWLKKKEGKVELGIVKPAAEKAKKFLFLELPEKGQKIEKGESIAEYEAMKRVGELKSPLNGKIAEINKKAVEKPGKVIEEPYKTWLVRLKTKKDLELNKYMHKKEAEKHYRKQV
ncbi:MAG: hypothetical protein MUP58_01955 [Candidatus Nanohaloarchaeota archaeon QJJ-9]|nr:hypothetical protein [Candidatus Nanohaloarchaeota archaeon QJJ-9]